MSIRSTPSYPPPSADSAPRSSPTLPYQIKEVGQVIQIHSLTVSRKGSTTHLTCMRNCERLAGVDDDSASSLSAEPSLASPSDDNGAEEAADERPACSHKKLIGVFGTRGCPELNTVR